MNLGIPVTRDLEHGRHVAVRTLVAFAALSLASSFTAAPANGQGDAVVELVVEADERAREWDVAVTGGVASTSRLTLEPITLGFHGEFTVAVAEDAASVTLTAELPDDWELGNVGCLDDLDPPTEIDRNSAERVSPSSSSRAAGTVASLRASLWRSPSRRSWRRTPSPLISISRRRTACPSSAGSRLRLWHSSSRCSPGSSPQAC